jgi:alpha-1,3-rhamnosyltransferase
MNQEDKPLVTAVIPVYNHEPYVVESIRSVINQTYRNIELIMINDGSKDGSHDKCLTLVEECKRRFVRFEYIYRENIGLSATLNEALSMAKGAYFTALASDDVALPRKVEVLVDALEAKGPVYAAAFGDALFINSAGTKLCLDKSGRTVEDESGEASVTFLEWYTRERRFSYKEEDFGAYRTLIESNYLPAMSNVLRTAAISEAGGWTRGNALEDWEMWLKLSKRYKFCYVDEPLALYRSHEHNTAKNQALVIRAALRLIAREGEYCRTNGMDALWRRLYYERRYRFLRDRGVPFWTRLSLLERKDKRSLALFIIQSAPGKALRRLGRYIGVWWNHSRSTSARRLHS